MSYKNEMDNLIIGNKDQSGTFWNDLRKIIDNAFKTNADDAKHILTFLQSRLDFLLTEKALKNGKEYADDMHDIFMKRTNIWTKNCVKFNSFINCREKIINAYCFTCTENLL